MKNKRKFIPVMLTPYDQSGKVDYPALARLTEYYIRAGATALFANCLSSEMYELSPEERLATTAFVVKVADGAIPVYSTGTFSPDTDLQVEFTKRIYDTGVKGVIAITSILAPEEADDILLVEKFLQLIARTAGIPLGIYECPFPYKRVLSASQLQKIVRTKRIIYYKDTSLDISAVTAKVEATRDYTDFELYEAYMVNAVASLQAGCAGLSCIQSNFVPELISWLVAHFNDPAFIEETALTQQFLVDAMDVMHNAYPLSAKYFLQQKGLPIEVNTRRNVGTLSAAIKQQLDQLLLDYEKIQSQLGLCAVSGR